MASSSASKISIPTNSIKLTLGMMDLDYSLRHEAPATITSSSTTKQKLEYDKWERPNRMSLIIIKNSILVAIRRAIPIFDNAKTYLDSVEEQFKGSSSACKHTNSQDAYKEIRWIK
ncbi:hypothetical protein E3N88_40321 [Mikania micrantha]|uniref:Uncharacterized protein n=1 Tax=Mikania micrantha TaxID=192012 RepID=A0A5N6LMF5_9ASTR|nr:hypothetical protein E3N88_40321 [Mikania micrantha]